MRTNTRVVHSPTLTHEGAPASRINAEQALRRSVLACLLWEDSFYEDGESIAHRIAGLVPQVQAAKVAALAVEAREKMKLRHVPLLLVSEMVRHVTHRPYVADTLEKVIQRADEMAEFLSLYWREGKTPIAAQVKKGLARAFNKFDAYQFAKYRGADRAIKLRDVMFLTHPKPDGKRGTGQGRNTKAERKLGIHDDLLFKNIADDTLPTPDTWEVALSANDGVDKREKWERLLRENRLGDLALLRNLRNMEQAGVDRALIVEAIGNIRGDRVLPFRFIAAAKAAPRFEPELEFALFRSLTDKPRLAGKTVILVDVSGSMDWSLSAKSDMNRIDAACGVAVIGKELCDDAVVYTFSRQLVLVPPRRGFALRDAVLNSQHHSDTFLGDALRSLEREEGRIDRLIVITDEQSHDRVGPPPVGTKGYMVNVASYANGVGYGKWNHIDGFSEAIFDYIRALEEHNATGI